MAEIVEYRISRNLDELNLLVDFGILDKKHAKEIISKREDFEYTLRRRTRTKLDFLKYIKFEINLLNSIESYRRTVLKENSKPKENATAEDDIERKILLLQAKKLNDVIRSRCAHISSLFRKLTTTFQFDKNLWLAYIEFAKSRKWNTRVSALYWRLLRVSGEDPELWLAAANHEIEINKAFDSARGLYLRALRHHPIYSKLWADYFKMEVRYMEIVGQRAKVVFRTLEAMKDDESQKKDPTDIWAEDQPTAPSLDLAEESNLDNDEIEADSGEKFPVKKTIAEDDAILTGHLPKVVYNNAKDSLRGNQEFEKFVMIILAFLHAQSTETEGVKLAKDHIFADLQRNASDRDSEVLRALVEKFDDRVFVDEQLEKVINHSRQDSPTKKIRRNGLSKMEMLYECYESKGVEETRKLYAQLDKSIRTQTLSLYVGMIQVELWQLPKEKELHQLDRLRAVYEKALLKFGRIKPKLWYEYIALEYDHAKSLEDFDRINQIYQRAQDTLESTKTEKLIEKYTLIQTADCEREFSDYSDLED